jgi:hypothetical protein
MLGRWATPTCSQKTLIDCAWTLFAQAKRDTEAVKLRNELEARISTLEGYADRMDTKFGGSFAPGEDGG